MKKIFLALGLVATVNIAFSQEEPKKESTIEAKEESKEDVRTLFNNDTTTKAKSTFGGYGATIVGATALDGDLAIIIGGKGAMVKNRRFAFGGVGKAIIGTVENQYENYEVDEITGLTDTTLKNDNITMGYGGLFIEYIFKYESPIHMSIPLNVQVGGVAAGGDDDDRVIKKSFVFVVEPAINIEFNFTKFFIPTLNVGYRFVIGENNVDKLSGVYGALLLKFGKY